MRAFIGVLALLASTGCGGAAASHVPSDPGDPASPPAMEALPSVASGEGLTERMRVAWQLADESLAMRPPPLPERTDTATLLHWTQTELGEWLERKSRLVEAATAELSTAAEQGHLQRIVAGAVVALVHEDVASALRAVPMPEDLHAEPEIAAIYRDVVEHRASSWVERARSAYLACARNAIQPATMHHWSVFCAKRADGLPPRRFIPTEEGTTVTVSIDY